METIILERGFSIMASARVRGLAVGNLVQFLCSRLASG
jgi:hypothetical protein